MINYETKNVPRQIPQDIALSIYRVVQEGLSNISRHAQATKVDISLVGKDDAIHLVISDNGVGFDPGQIRKKGGLGLASMKERAYLTGADFSLESHPRKGTVIKILAPLSRSTA